MGRSKESPSEPGIPESIGDAMPRNEAATEAFVAPEVDQAAQVSASRRNVFPDDLLQRPRARSDAYQIELRQIWLALESAEAKQIFGACTDTNLLFTSI